MLKPAPKHSEKGERSKSSRGERLVGCGRDDSVSYGFSVRSESCYLRPHGSSKSPDKSLIIGIIISTTNAHKSLYLLPWFYLDFISARLHPST